MNTSVAAIALFVSGIALIVSVVAAYLVARLGGSFTREFKLQ